MIDELELDPLFAEVGGRAKGDWQRHLADWICFATRHGSMERGSRRLDERLRELHALESLIVHYVDGAAAVHQGLGEPVVTDFWLHNQCDSPGIFDPGRVISATPVDFLLRPVQPARNVDDDGVDADGVGEYLPFAPAGGAGESMEGAVVIAESLVGRLVLVLVLVGVAGLRAPGLLNLFELKALRGRVSGDSAVLAMVGAGGIENLGRRELSPCVLVVGAGAAVLAVTSFMVSLALVGVGD